MFDMLIGFILMVALSWQGLAGLFLLGILFEYNECRGWSVFTGLIVAVSSYFFFQIPLAEIFVGIGVYLFVGVLWSFWRYKRYVEKSVIIARKLSGLDLTLYLRRLHPSENLSKITAWIIIWPFSMIENLCSDIINFIETLVSKVFKGVYNKIYSSATASFVDLE
jgi:Zn-dependent protease with chaperone function